MVVPPAGNEWNGCWRRAVATSQKTRVVKHWMSPPSQFGESLSECVLRLPFGNFKPRPKYIDPTVGDADRVFVVEGVY
jgi:hypothetical protein